MLGFELMNEPFAGAVLRFPDLLLPGVAGARNLQPLYARSPAPPLPMHVFLLHRALALFFCDILRMYDAVGGGIRQVNQKHIIFYEPVDWGMVLEGKCVVARLLKPCLILRNKFALIDAAATQSCARDVL